GGARPYIALAKLLEHRLRDVKEAAEVTRRGLLYASDLPESAFSQADFDDLTARYARLLRKLDQGVK
ncbi:MAG: hypothetical protein IJS53_01215, partial [Clostridia bacterium]|nr:hypothetical protein [Clostridia bacterium]